MKSRSAAFDHLAVPVSDEQTVIGDHRSDEYDAGA